MRFASSSMPSRVGADQPLAWQNLSTAYFDAGRYEESRKAIETALKLQDSTNTRAGLYTLAIVTGDRALADAQVAAVHGRRDEVADGRGLGWRPRRISER